MNIVTENLRKEYASIEQNMKIISQRMSQYPEGYIRVSKRKNGVQYYYCKTKKEENYTEETKQARKHGVYIHKDQRELIRLLAQKEYDKKVLNFYSVQRKVIERFLKSYDEQGMERIYHQMGIDKTKWIQPIQIPLDEKLKIWEEETYEGKGFSENNPEIRTKKGERVRSKSEKIIADKLYSNGILYKYEKPFYMRDGSIWYPDFTIYNVRTGREWYWEHFGMMEKNEYSNNAIKKINRYSENGVIVGENLLVSFETIQFPISEAVLEGNIRIIKG